ncbi:MAG: Rid family hydrolase [Alphaproteobacteria bacterium]
MASSDRSFITPKGYKWLDGRAASAAVRCGNLLFVSGQTATDGDLAPEALGDVKAQARIAFAKLRAVIEGAGGTMDDILDIMSFHTDPRDIDAVLEVARDWLPEGRYPAWTAFGSTGLQRPGILVSIRAIAHLGQGEKRCVTPASMKWLGALPVSAGCRKGSYMFVSGILSSDASGKVVNAGDHEAQARNAYARLKEVMEAGGSSLDDIIDMIAFNQDARGMDASVDTWCNEAVAGLPIEQATSYTAIATTGLYRLGHVGAYRAIADFSPGPRVAHNLPSVHWHEQRVSGATRKKGGRLLGISGQVASDGKKNIIARGDTAEQARYCFGQIRGVLEKHGASLDDVVEITSFHKDPRAWEIVMEVGKEVFKPGRGPAWTPVGATGLYLEGYLHEIYALAMV